MNPLATVRTWLDRRRLNRELRALNGGGGYVPAAPVLSGTYITPETALGLASVYAAVNVIAGDLATMPRNVMRIIPGGGYEIDENHWLQDLISIAPNDEEDGFRYFQSTMCHVLTRGNGYSEIVRDRQTGRPTSLHILHPAKTVPKRSASGRLYYELNDGATGFAQEAPKLAPENVLHLAGMGFNGLVGYSPVTVCRQTIGLAVGAEQYGASFYGNYARPGGILKTPQKLTEAAVNNLRRSFNQVHQGSQSAHQIAILEQGLEWVQTQFSPEDGQFLLTRKFQVEEIARMYRLPPHKLGDYSQAHLANVEEANLEYLTMSLLVWVTMIEAQLNSKLLTREDRKTHVIRMDMSALMRGNSKARTDYYTAMRNTGAINSNEIRHREGMNPIGPQGDLYIVQGQYIPLDQVGKQPVAKPPPEKNALLDLDHRFGLNGDGATHGQAA